VGVSGRGGGGLAGGVCRVLRAFVGRVFRCPVRVQGGHALQLRTIRAFNEGPRRIDRCSWTFVIRVTLLEERQDFLSSLDGIASDYTDFVQAQLKVTRSDRHVVIVAAPRTNRVRSGRLTRRHAARDNSSLMKAIAELAFQRFLALIFSVPDVQRLHRRQVRQLPDRPHP
jgi:hypothetical protein